jgi:hypothetical protein
MSFSLGCSDSVSVPVLIFAASVAMFIQSTATDEIYALSNLQDLSTFLPAARCVEVSMNQRSHQLTTERYVLGLSWPLMFWNRIKKQLEESEKVNASLQAQAMQIAASVPDPVPATKKKSKSKRKKKGKGEASSEQRSRSSKKSKKTIDKEEAAEMASSETQT